MREKLFYVRELNKFYGDKQVLNNLSFEVNKGEVLGILGSNGAGKSTMFGIISGLTKGNSGEIGFQDGKGLYGSKEYKCRLGIVPQDISLYANMTVKENLILFSRLYGLRGKNMITNVNNLIEELKLSDKTNTDIKNLSGGMKRRVNIAAAIVHNPSLIIMDEPTVGIDPENRNAVWDIIESLRSKGKSVILTSHYIEEIDKLSDRVIIVDKGRKVAEGKSSDLVEEYGKSITYSIEFFMLSRTSVADLKNNIEEEITFKDIEFDENKINITVDANQENYIEILIKLAKKNNLEIKNINVKKANLEDVFILFIERGKKNEVFSTAR